MSTRKKLQRWQDNGLIEQDVMQNILAYEKKRGAGRFSKAMFGLGGFAIIIGVLAVVAANWQIIPPYTKLYVHLAVNALAAFAAFKYAAAGKSLQANLSVLALTGLTLTLIALTGQVFHLNGTFADALILWAILATPAAVVYGTGNISLIPWIIGLVAAIILGFHEHVLSDMEEKSQTVAVAAFMVALPLSFIHISSFALTGRNPALQSKLYYAGAAVLVICASLGCLAWYIPDMFFLKNNYGPHMLGIAVIGMVWARFIPLPEPIVSKDEKPYLRRLMYVSVAIGFLPFIIPHSGDTFFAALSFTAYWLFVGYIAQKTDRQALLTLAIVLVAIRIYVVYLELFGGLLVTGFGLITSGVVLIGLAWGARKINKTLSGISVEGGDDVQ